MFQKCVCAVLYFISYWEAFNSILSQSMGGTLNPTHSLTPDQFLASSFWFLSIHFSHL